MHGEGEAAAGVRFVGTHAWMGYTLYIYDAARLEDGTGSAITLQSGRVSHAGGFMP